MKKIFRGRKYDTETAELVGFAATKRYANFEWKEEKLYRKRTGEFFLYGKGGADTEYGKQTDVNVWRDGEAIKPISYDDAREWAEEKLTADEYERIFGVVDEGSEKRTVALSLDVSLHEKLKQEAVKRGISVSALVSEFAKTI